MTTYPRGSGDADALPSYPLPDGPVAACVREPFGTQLQWCGPCVQFAPYGLRYRVACADCCRPPGFHLDMLFTSPAVEPVPCQ